MHCRDLGPASRLPALVRVGRQGAGLWGRGQGQESEAKNDTGTFCLLAPTLFSFPPNKKTWSSFSREGAGGGKKTITLTPPHSSFLSCIMITGFQEATMTIS